jgi:hypothetical protein
MTIGLFTYSPSSFIIHFTNGAEEIAWVDIESVFAYKVDWMTFDDVHINLIVKGEIVNIREDIDGFDTFIENLHQHLPGLKNYWIVVQPAFETNFTMLYDKFGRTQEEVENIYYRDK